MFDTIKSTAGFPAIAANRVAADPLPYFLLEREGWLELLKANGLCVDAATASVEA